MVFFDVGDHVLCAGVLLRQLFRRDLIVFDGVVVELRFDLAGQGTHGADRFRFVVQFDAIGPFERFTGRIADDLPRQHSFRNR